MARPRPGDSRSLLLFSRKQKDKQHKHMLLSSKNVDSSRGKGGPNQRKEGGNISTSMLSHFAEAQVWKASSCTRPFPCSCHPQIPHHYTLALTRQQLHLQTPWRTPCGKLLSPVNLSSCLKKSFSPLGEAKGLGTSLSPPGTA